MCPSVSQSLLHSSFGFSDCCAEGEPKLSSLKRHTEQLTLDRSLFWIRRCLILFLFIKLKSGEQCAIPGSGVKFAGEDLSVHLIGGEEIYVPH